MVVWLWDHVPREEDPAQTSWWSKKDMAGDKPQLNGCANNALPLCISFELWTGALPCSLCTGTVLVPSVVLHCVPALIELPHGAFALPIGFVLCCP